MTGWAIVAIPEEQDYVWNISSEEIPHMTLLFLGDQGDDARAIRIAEFLEHIASTGLPRFGVDVTRRGELGPDNADVVFLNTDYAPKVVEARKNMLQNNDISELFNSVTQYPEWTPHLTLGYPTAPAKPDERDYPGVRWITFDRLALWTGEFDGPTFQLEAPNEFAMSDVVLRHFGVLGMRWGHRKPGTGQPSSHVKRTDDHEDHTKSRDLKKQKPRTLSNQELKALNNRLQLEKTLGELNRGTNPIEKGHAKVKTILAFGATATAAYTFANSPLGKEIQKAVKSALTK